MDARCCAAHVCLCQRGRRSCRGVSLCTDVGRTGAAHVHGVSRASRHHDRCRCGVEKLRRLLVELHCCLLCAVRGARVLVRLCNLHPHREAAAKPRAAHSRSVWRVAALTRVRAVAGVAEACSRCAATTLSAIEGVPFFANYHEAPHR
eukprot:Amastigsp_a9968_10.p1 type:complete len:148 gc:universal Amastigsp_a9968_10:510-67(-)